MGNAVVIEHLSKSFRLYHEKNQSLKTVFLRGGRARYEEFWAVDDVSFEVPEGSTFGLIGSNGSGKSTLLKCLARILRPDRGQITTQGRISALLDLGTAFHPELSGRDNIYLNGSILGLRRREIDKRLDEIIAFADIGRHIDTPVKHYSSGMYVRLGFAVAINVDPDILLVDEVLAVGDEAFQRKCVQRFEELRSGGRTVVVVSHSLSSVAAMCDTVALLNRGHLEKLGSSREVIEDYLGTLFTEADANGALRWGSQEARITKAEVIDGSGQPTHFARLGERVTFRFHYRADVAIEEPLFHFAISHVDGTLVTNPNTRELAQVPEKIEGDGFVDYVVPKLLLIPGKYDVSVGVLDRSGEHAFDRRNKVVQLDVGVGRPAETSGIVSLGGRFRGTPYGDLPASCGGVPPPADGEVDGTYAAAPAEHRPVAEGL
jgi:ABC-2 type transport system ATP-binding protein